MTIKIGVASDIHMEFYDTNPEFYDWSGDILILAGDICEGREYRKYHNFWSQAAAMAEHVILIAGNHEYYGSCIDNEIDNIREELSRYKNFHILDNESIELYGIQFTGSTLWTNLEKYPIVSAHAQQQIYDYKTIRTERDGEERRIRPSDTSEYYKNALEYLEDVVSNGKRTVVITHHAPSERSVGPNFVNNYLNPAFVNDLDCFIEAYPNIEQWIHGHTHDFFNYHIGTCQVTCNPRGYPGERPRLLPPFVPYTIMIDKSTLAD